MGDRELRRVGRDAAAVAQPRMVAGFFVGDAQRQAAVAHGDDHPIGRQTLTIETKSLGLSDVTVGIETDIGALLPSCAEAGFFFR